MGFKTKTAKAHKTENPRIVNLVRTLGTVNKGTRLITPGNGNIIIFTRRTRRRTVHERLRCFHQGFPNPNSNLLFRVVPGTRITRRLGGHIIPYNTARIFSIINTGALLKDHHPVRVHHPLARGGQLRKRRPNGHRRRHEVFQRREDTKFSNITPHHVRIRGNLTSLYTDRRNYDKEFKLNRKALKEIKLKGYGNFLF